MRGLFNNAAIELSGSGSGSVSESGLIFGWFQALLGLWGNFSWMGNRGHAQVVEREEPTKWATKRKRQSVRRSVGRSVESPQGTRLPSAPSNREIEDEDDDEDEDEAPQGTGLPAAFSLSRPTYSASPAALIHATAHFIAFFVAHFVVYASSQDFVETALGQPYLDTKGAFMPALYPTPGFSTHPDHIQTHTISPHKPGTAIIVHLARQTCCRHSAQGKRI